VCKEVELFLSEIIINNLMKLPSKCLFSSFASSLSTSCSSSSASLSSAAFSPEKFRISYSNTPSGVSDSPDSSPSGALSFK